MYAMSPAVDGEPYSANRRIRSPNCPCRSPKIFVGALKRRTVDSFANISSAAAHSSSISAASRMNDRSAGGSHARGCKSSARTFLCTLSSAPSSSASNPPLPSGVPYPGSIIAGQMNPRTDPLVLVLELIDRQLPDQRPQPSARVRARGDHDRAVMQPHVRPGRPPRPGTRAIRSLRHGPGRRRARGGSAAGGFGRGRDGGFGFVRGELRERRRADVRRRAVVAPGGVDREGTPERRPEPAGPIRLVLPAVLLPARVRRRRARRRRRRLGFQRRQPPHLDGARRVVQKPDVREPVPPRGRVHVDHLAQRRERLRARHPALAQGLLGHVHVAEEIAAAQPAARKHERPDAGDGVPTPPRRRRARRLAPLVIPRRGHERPPRARPRGRVQHRERGRVVDHAAPPQRAAGHVQPRADERDAVLIPRRRRLPRRGRPLPPPVAVTRQTERVRERRAVRAAAAAQEKQPVRPRRGGGVHAGRRDVARRVHLAPLVRLGRRVEAPRVAQQFRPVVPAVDDQESLRDERDDVRVSLSRAWTADDDAVPPRRALQVEDVEVLRREPRGADAALDDDHVADRRRGVRRARGRALARGFDLGPNPGSHVEGVHVGRRAGEACVMREDGRMEETREVRT
eukprot:30599-Pelagococcus_subviridis.AAC.2